MPNGTDAPDIPQERMRGFWSRLDIVIVNSAPLETLLKWLETAEMRYGLTVPENYPKLSVLELREWIIEQINKEIEDTGGSRPDNLQAFIDHQENIEKENANETQLTKQCTRFGLTELGNCERLIHRYGKDLKYCHIFGKWYIWNGKYWKPDDVEGIVRLAKATIRKIPSECEYATTDDQYKAIMKHALSCETNGKIRAIVSLAGSEVAVMPQDFDTKPNLFNCQNGTYDLVNGYFREHRKEDVLSMMSGVTYDPDAKCPLWLEHLKKVFNLNFDLIETFQEMCGYSLLLENPEQIIFILHGDGKNGKSVTVKTLSAMMHDYAKNVDPSTLMVKKYADGPRTDIARLVGARVITSTEGEDGQKLAESLIKQLTGGDKITVRRLYEKEFEFSPTFKIWFATNHKPKISGTDNAIWRRIWLIPFLVTIPEADRDNNIDKKLLTELAGIFNWCIEGLRRYQERGHLKPSPMVIAATQEYKKESNTLEEFFLDMCSFPDENTVNLQQFFVHAGELYIAYKEYCHSLGDDPITMTAFGKIMNDRDGIVVTRGSKGKQYNGIRLKI